MTKQLTHFSVSGKNITTKTNQQVFTLQKHTNHLSNFIQVQLYSLIQVMIYYLLIQKLI